MSNIIPISTKIYFLFSSEDSTKIRYIGKTVGDINKRLERHIRIAKHSEAYHCPTWIRSVLSNGNIPVITIIGEVEGDGCKEEIAWIVYGIDEGWNLTNNTRGGDGFKGGHKHTLETIEKIRQASIGRHLTDVAKEKISIAAKNRPPDTPEIKERKCLAAQNRPPPTKETLEKIKIAVKKYWKTPKSREKARIAALNKPSVTLEARKNMSIAQNRPDVKMKKSIAKKGTHDSLITRQNKSIAASKRKPESIELKKQKSIRMKLCWQQRRKKHTDKNSVKIKQRKSIAIKMWWQKRKSQKNYIESISSC